MARLSIDMLGENIVMNAQEPKGVAVEGALVIRGTI